MRWPLALLEQFQGVLVHDGWMPYKALACQHALCNAHHLRELTYLLEEHGQAWAGDMIELLTHASHQDRVNRAQGEGPDYTAKNYQAQVRELRDLYDAILCSAPTIRPVQVRGIAHAPREPAATRKYRFEGCAAWR